MSAPASPITDDELLYRRVRHEDYRCQADGTSLVLSVAFADRRYRPSVNRAPLCGHDPTVMVVTPTDGVVGILVADVRATDTIVQNDARGRPLQVYLVDVEPVPLPDNPAHAEIFLHPDCDTVSDSASSALAWLAWQMLVPGNWPRPSRPCNPAPREMLAVTMETAGA